jgi:hypothetical protein
MSERIQASETLPTNITADNFSEAHEDIDVIPEKTVRELSAALPPARSSHSSLPGQRTL